MKLRFSYHSEHQADPGSRWVHFLLFAGAILLLAAAAQQLFLWWTDWHATDDATGGYHLIMGAVYLLFGAGLAFIGYRRARASRGVTDRYVRIDDDSLRWKLTQQEAEQRLPLARITAVERTNVRDLTLTLADGGREVIPIYLVSNPVKQGELEAVLRASVGG